MQKMHDDMHKGMMSNDPDAAFAAATLTHHLNLLNFYSMRLAKMIDSLLRLSVV